MTAVRSVVVDANPPVLSAAQSGAISSAAGLIAPVWPLDQSIAVNPHWQLRHLPRQDVAAKMSALGGIQCLMPPDYYLKAWHQDQISEDDVQMAQHESSAQLSLSQLIQALELPPTPPPGWCNLSDLLDTQRSARQMSWREEIHYQISQFCAAWCQQQKPLLTGTGAGGRASFYSDWLCNIRQDRGVSVLMSAPSLPSQFHALPAHAEELLADAISTLEIADAELERICHALLLDINGWASHLAWRAWQKQGNHRLIELTELLAVRLAWELVLWRDVVAQDAARAEWCLQAWRQQKSSLDKLVERHAQAQQALWIWARALEISEQKALRNQLTAGLVTHCIQEPSLLQQSAVTLQAVFCIDVRSEPMRRAFEQQGPHIETAGFAGFFGLPIACEPGAGHWCRPQLPGLLAPQLTVRPVTTCDTLTPVQNQARWQQWGESAAGSFAMVESAGAAYLFNLLRQSIRPKTSGNPVNRQTHAGQWQISRGGRILDKNELAVLVQPVLVAMGLRYFAKTVLLVGHGSHTANNLQAAALDCGACGGQTGEVNVRVLAQLLNDGEVRDVLRRQGVNLPDSCRFVAALHNTTTDHIECFDVLAAEQLKPVLDAAQTQAQQMRARLFDDLSASVPAAKLDQAFRNRSHDWSQPRPEWGLANNKAFVIAPRAWTRATNLQGRVFLHDYCWQSDAHNQYSVLEMLMTAPMIVTHWINMQYNASMADNHKLGSGNKLLHNAVGGNLGVFEGNAGDLRIGLARQSLHNGQRWMHTPVRLSVYIAAPSGAIADIVAKHSMLQALTNNDWIELYQWQADQGFARYYKGRWQLVQLLTGGR